MTEEEQYQRGLKRLGLKQCPGEVAHDGWPEQPPHWIDLRKDPAFAWRVLMAFKQGGLIRNTANPDVGWHFVSSDVQTPEFWYADAADALYAAVCALGASK